MTGDRVRFCLGDAQRSVVDLQQAFTSEAWIVTTVEHPPDLYLLRGLETIRARR